MMLLPLCVMIFFAKEPPDIEHQSLSEHLSCLFEADGWYFNLIYIITFGGFIGLGDLPAIVLLQPIPRHQDAGRNLTVLATLTGSRDPRARRLVRRPIRWHHHAVRRLSRSPSPASSV